MNELFSSKIFGERVDMSKETSYLGVTEEITGKSNRTLWTKERIFDQICGRKPIMVD